MVFSATMNNNNNKKPTKFILNRFSYFEERVALSFSLFVEVDNYEVIQNLVTFVILYGSLNDITWGMNQKQWCNERMPELTSKYL